MRKLTILCSLILSQAAWSQSVSPPDRAFTTSTRPTVSADFNRQIQGARVWIDGVDFTNSARTYGDTVSVTPNYNLDYGLHQVQVVTNNGLRKSWSFNIVDNDQATAPNYDPYYNGNRDDRYYPNSNDPNYYPNDNDPRYYPSSDGNYYPNRNSDRYPDDNKIRVEDVLPAVIRLIPNNRY